MDREYFSILKEIELFRGIEDVESMSSCLSIMQKSFQKNEFIFDEGNYYESFGVVVKGRAAIIKEDYFGNRNISAVVKERELFGESFASAQINGVPISVVSLDNSVVLFVDYHKIISPCAKCCEDHQKLIGNMLRIVSMKNVYLNQKVDILSQRSTREKLLMFLSYMAKKSGSSTFEIEFSRQELADYLCVERSAMSNEISKLVKDRIIVADKRRFTLLN